MTTKILELCATRNGTYTNVTNLLKPGAYSVDHIDVAPNRERSPMTGTGYSNRVARKLKISADCNPLKQADSQRILALLKLEYLYANYLDPELGWQTGVEFLSNNVPATALVVEKHGNTETTRWDGITFTLEEV